MRRSVDSISNFGGVEVTDEEISARGVRSSAVEEAQALNALIGALAPLEQATRIRLLRTMATFFEFSAEDVLSNAITQRVSASTNAGPPDTRKSFAPSFSEDRSLTAKAFLLDKRPQSDVERIACLAYYLTHYRDQATFKTLELSKLNTEAAQIKLSNPTRAVDNAAGAHFLLPAGQGKKQMSAIGEIYVQALPDRAAAREAVSDLKRRRAKKGRSPGVGDPADSIDVEDVPIETPLSEGSANGGT